MIRAGVFIGVDKTGGLQKLNDAAAGARRMYEWALAQGMADKSHAKPITDAGGVKVNPDLIYDAIKAVIDGPGVDQLIVYYAGHGVNINRSEQWLLTDAPVKTSAAVNVSGSVELARYCGIQHVVIISDACRVAPEGIQAQNVRGVDIFPNETASDKSKPVDQFYACVLGRTAAEIRDGAVAAGNYSALYTSVLLDALSGSRPDVLELAAEDGGRTRYVRTRRLERYLESEVPQRIKALNLQQKVNQNPDAIITSDQSWVSRISTPAEASVEPPRPSEAPPDSFEGSPGSFEEPSDSSLTFTLPVPVKTPTVNNLRTVSQNLMRFAAQGEQYLLQQQIEEARNADVAGVDQLVKTAERIERPFGPDHFETQCGFKVRGARIVEFFAPRAEGELLGEEGDILRINHLEEPAASVLLRFQGNIGTVVPAIPGFVAALTFDERELVDVAYEPSANTARGADYQYDMQEVRTLRAIAAAASQHGRFSLEQEDAFNLARRMQYAKSIDPTLSVYAAYAYHDLQEIELISGMSYYQRDDLGFIFFDLALLSRKLIERRISSNTGVFPFFPLLSQGWALLRANRVRLHPALDGIERNVRESLWSLFDDDGLEKLRDAMHTREVR